VCFLPGPGANETVGRRLHFAVVRELPGRLWMWLANRNATAKGVAQPNAEADLARLLAFGRCQTQTICTSAPGLPGDGRCTDLIFLFYSYIVRNMAIHRSKRCRSRVRLMAGPAALTRHARPLSWGRLFVVQLSVRVGRYGDAHFYDVGREAVRRNLGRRGRSCKEKGVETEWGNASYSQHQQDRCIWRFSCRIKFLRTVCISPPPLLGEEEATAQQDELAGMQR
jgi:hypothetical protein